MKYYTYMNRNEIISLLAQIPSFDFDIDILQYISTVNTKISNDVNICPELYCGCDKENRRRIDIRASQFESRDCLESVIATNIQDITDIRTTRLYYGAIDKLVKVAQNNNSIYYDKGRFEKPLNRTVKKRGLLSRSTQESFEEIENANYLMLNGAKILTEQTEANFYRSSSTINTINEIFESEMNVLGHFIQNNENGRIIKPIAMYIEY